MVLARSSYLSSEAPPSAAAMASLGSSLRVFALWHHGVAEALQLFHALPRSAARRQVVFAQLANGERLPSGMLHELKSQGVSVVPVSSRLREATDDAPELRAAVIRRLEEQERLLSLEASTQAPTVDEEAATAVDAAYNNLAPATPAQRRDHLDEFYGTDEADDGVR